MDFRNDPDIDFRNIEELSKKEATAKAAALREGIVYHDRRYYRDDVPVIADAVYDRLFARLQELETGFSDLTTGSVSGNTDYLAVARLRGGNSLKGARQK